MFEELYLDRSFDYFAVEANLGTNHRYAREKIWKKLPDLLNIQWDEEDDDAGRYKYSEACWLPWDSVDMPIIAVYPLSGKRRLDSLVLRFFLDKYIVNGLCNVQSMKAFKLCGNPLCCNPSHQLLIPKARKSPLSEVEDMDVLDSARLNIKGLLATKGSKGRMSWNDLTTTIACQVLTNPAVDASKYGMLAVEDLYVQYHVSVRARMLIGKYVAYCMRGMQYPSSQDRAKALYELTENLIQLGPFTKNAPSRDEVDEVVKELNNWTTNTDHHEVLYPPKKRVLVKAYDEDITLNELHEQETETKPVDEIEAVLKDEEDADLELDKVTYNGTTVDKMDDDELRQQLLETGMSEEEVDAILNSEGENNEE
jgi:hypothetical protein